MITDNDRNECQTAFRIIVVASREDALRGIGDMWDSGRALSGEQVAIPYAGNPLKSRTKYWWAVKTWDKDGHECPWSVSSTFETAFLNPFEWKAKLVGGPYERYRKEFVVDRSKTVTRARAYVSAMGLYEVRVNGRKIGGGVLEPNLADFRKRLWYSTYDVSQYLAQGKNVVGWSMSGGYVGRVWHTLADRKFILQMEINYSDGTCGYHRLR